MVEYIILLEHDSYTLHIRNTPPILYKHLSDILHNFHFICYPLGFFWLKIISNQHLVVLHFGVWYMRVTLDIWSNYMWSHTHYLHNLK